MMGQMRQRMNNPEMRKRMQQHMQMMQSMLEGEDARLRDDENAYDVYADDA